MAFKRNRDFQTESSRRDDNLALQAKCYEQARSLYGSLGYPKGRIAGFGNHYNQKLGKCFLDVMNLETAGPDSLWMHDDVLEAVTGAEDAAYTALVPSRNLTPAAPPSRCEVRLPSGELRICGADEEFGELINVYMEVE